MRGVQPDEAVRRRDGQFRLVIFVVRIGDFELCLLGITAVRVARLERFVIVDRRLVISRCHGLFGLAVKLLRRPVFRRIVFGRGAGARKQYDDANNQILL